MYYFIPTILSPIINHFPKISLSLSRPTRRTVLRESFTYRLGARYYDPRISQFYGVDPLAHKYPGMSPFTYTADNPVMLVDADGRAPEDIIYYNLKGKEVKRIKKDGPDIKMIVLTKSKKETTVNTAIDSGHVINVITEEEARKIDEIYNFANIDKTETEKGYLRGENNVTSQIVTGSVSGEILAKDFRPAKKELRDKGVKILSNVHLHPFKYDESGNLIEYGAPKPSEADLDYVSHYSQPSMILGFTMIKHPLPPNQIGGTPKLEYKPTIGFYNSNGNIITIYWSDLRRAIRKINKQ